MTSGVKTGSEGEPELLPETPTWIEENAPTRKMFQEWTSDVTVVWYPTLTDEPLSKEEAMRDRMLTAMMLLMWTTASHADMDFDPRYERDYNIFNPAAQYQPDNPFNPANSYDPNGAFNPVNRYDLGNPSNPINQYSPNNPFNPVNRYHPDNPLNPANKYNPDVPFAPLDGGSGIRKTR